MSYQLEFNAMTFASNIASKVLSRFNPAMLSLAREAMGYSQKQLAGILKCAQTRVSKLEAGSLLPNEDDIQKFVVVLQQHREFFFQQEAATVASVSFYRKAQSLPLMMLRRCNAEMNVRRLQIEREVSGIKFGPKELLRLSPELCGGAVKVAQKMRQEWCLGNRPIANLTRLIEDANCVIIEHPFPSRKLDGLSIRSTGRPSIIFLNSELPNSRRRLSLAHELGHLVMHMNPSENVEQEAWDFAEEFLAPAQEISGQLENLTIDRLGQLKCHWGMSMQAILQRAKKLHKISDSYHRYLWIQIGKCGYRTHEPFEDVVPNERPTNLEQRLKTKT